MKTNPTVSLEQPHHRVHKDPTCGGGSRKSSLQGHRRKKKKKISRGGGEAASHIKNFRARLFIGVEFLGILRNLFLEMAKIREIKVKAYRWPPNNLPFNRK